MLPTQQYYLTEESGGGWQKNLSGTGFHASPEGVRLRDEPSTKFARSKLERVLFTRPERVNHRDVVSNLTARQFN
jgi:hypothetical protein